VTDPGTIATRVEAGGEAPSFYGKWESEARKTIAAFGGAGSLSAAPSAPTTAAGRRTRSRAARKRSRTRTRGRADRLAGEVNWSLFSNGDTIYYMDGPDLIGQKPSLVLHKRKDADSIAHVEFTWDNTSIQHAHRDGKPKRKGAGGVVSRAGTPTEGKLHLICGEDDYRAGEVFVLKGCGPGDGRWIVSTAIRSAYTTFTEFTLVPPTAPIPEPAGTTIAGSSLKQTALDVLAGASGASGSVTSKGAFVGGIYANRKNWRGQDRGFDFAGAGAMTAFAAGTFTHVQGLHSNSGWPWHAESDRQGSLMCMRLDTAVKGASGAVYHFIYYAENFVPKVHAGQHVNAGDVVGEAAGVFAFTEQGFAGDANGNTYASLHGQPRDIRTGAGHDFQVWIGY
jgi:hypothetical protein